MNMLRYFAMLVGLVAPLALLFGAQGCSKPCNDLNEVCGSCGDATYAQDCKDIVNEGDDEVCSANVGIFQSFCNDDDGAGGGTGSTCSNGQVICDGQCVDIASSPAACGSCLNQCSGDTALCAGGECVASCPADLPTECDGGCIDTSSDPSHCGGCGTVCDAGQVCNGGSCADGCDEGDTECDGACVNLATSTLHCGSCGNGCQGSLCSAGTCSSTCDAGLVECDGTCVDTTSNPDYCGSCTNSCVDPLPACQTGVCVADCTGGFANCGGACVDTSTDSTNCGACGNLCPGGAPCVNGACSGGGCPAGQTDCNGTCVDVTSNPNHCGMCGEVCDIAGGEVCSTGVCTPTGCASGLTDCSGACVDTTTNPSHCGGCNTVCAGGQVCDGTCTTACGGGKTSCNGACVDPMASPQHCGECGTSCSDQSVCTFDQCTMGECSNISGAISCDDGNPCTNEQCDPATGCPADPSAFTLTQAEIEGLCQQTQGMDPTQECIFCDPNGDQCNSAQDGALCTGADTAVIQGEDACYSCTVGTGCGSCGANETCVGGSVGPPAVAGVCQ